ncbi:hypothetical protein Pla123a_28830 [Posidoniimonas polymericola]|uniref:Uncharacterized protein n=1 Tax=Posidoniimonas polymericola TaxID=2528002 RepID=A0A5C5YMF2_9BACT|nr:hypothetical protein [Posidoniimonas polymericola]TWT76094.1 hypothetical protein Pla123a_28830 [Posidoniimonas polymericola]
MPSHSRMVDREPDHQFTSVAEIKAAAAELAEERGLRPRQALHAVLSAYPKARELFVAEGRKKPLPL